MEKTYLNSIKLQFEYYKLLGEKTINQLTEKDLFWKQDESCNSIAVIVNHLNGNMLSRWTDFLTADGEKEWRNRDAEFEDLIKTKEALLSKWKEGWTCLFKAIESINAQNFDTVIYIRNMGHTVVEAFNRQLAHYAYHIGQIVLLGKLIKGKDWVSLSIPKGKSMAYNSEKFSKPKRKEHFTKSILKGKSSEFPDSNS